jgi:hypothetical protein
VTFLSWLFGKPTKELKLITTPPPQSIIPANQDQELINETDGFSFHVDELQTDFRDSAIVDIPFITPQNGCHSGMFLAGIQLFYLDFR